MKKIGLITNLFSFLIVAFTGSLFAQNFWQQTNGPYGGIVIAFTITSKGDIFAGTSGGGVFRSTDNGGNWAPVNTGLTNPSVRSFAINSMGHLFVGTRGGVFRSTDNGNSWTPVNTGLTNTRITVLAINLTSGHIFVGTDGGGVFRSMDNGENWAQVNTGLSNAIVRSFAINSSGHIFAGTNGGGVFRSTDNGGNWAPVNTGLTNTLVFALAINSSGYIFAGTLDGGVFRSTDNGNSWTSVNTGLTNISVFALAINSSGHIFAGTNGGGVFQSTDNGNSWTSVNTGLTNTDVRSFAINSSGHIFAGTSGGVFRSTDNGGSWTPVNAGLTNLYVYALVINSSGHIFAGTGGGGIFRSMDNGDSWTQVNTGLTNTDVDALAINSSGHIFAGTLYGGVFRSVQSTLTLAVVNPIPNQTLTEGVAPFIRVLNAPPAVFNSPDGATLSYTASSNDPTIARASLTGDTLTVTPLAVGNATITVTANDGKNDPVSTTFTVTVVTGNKPPAVTNAIPNQTLAVGGMSFVRDLNAAPVVFTDPNGDAQTFTASSSAPAIATPNISGSTLTIAPVTAGNATIIVTANDGKGGVTSTTFNVIVVAGNQPPTLANAIPNQTLAFGGAAFVRDLNAPPTVFNDLNGDPLTYTTSSNAPTTAAGNIAGSTLTVVPVNLGNATITVTASDGKGGTGQTTFGVTVVTTKMPLSNFFSISSIVPDPGEMKGSPQPGGDEQTAYRLISVPIDLDNKSARAVLEDDLGPYDIFKWRCFEARSDQTKAEYPNISDMAPGKAVWLIVKDQGKIIDTGAGKSNITSRPFAIALHPKWNLVGNPFNFAIPISKLRLQSSSQPPELRSYTGSWNNPTTERVTEILPFQGYAVFNSLMTADTLFVDPDLSSSGSVFPNEQLTGRFNDQSSDGKISVATGQSLSWSIRIHAQCQQARDIDNIAAVSATASDTHDEMDRPEPPVIGEYVSVYFPHSEWKTLSENYCTDVRPTTSDGGLWTFEVKTNIRDIVQLSFEGLDEVPPEFEVWLVDDALKISHNLREKNRYSVAGAVAVAEPAHPKRLKLVVGKRDFVDKQLATVQAVPSNYELSQNFPNPFNPVTTIRYGLPVEARVTLKVYNLFGQEVATLINHELKNAGYHAAIWDGRNNSGKVAASGVYFVRLRVGPSAGSGSAGSGQVFVQTRKMLLVE